MFKRLLPLSILFSTTLSAQVVRDTIFYDQYDLVTTKDQAKHFAVLSTLPNDLKNIESFKVGEKAPYSRGTGTIGEYNTIQYKGEMSYLDKQGKAMTSFFYSEDGQLESAVSYHPITNQKYEATYQDQVLYDGSLMQESDNILYFFVANEGTFLTYDMINPANHKNKLSYIFDENNTNTNAQYYDEQGVLRYDVSFIDYSPYQGTQVVLDSKRFSITDIYTYEEGNIVDLKSFYSNGQLKSTYQVEGETFSEIFYDTTGKEIARSTGILSDSEFKEVQDGESITFGYGEKSDDLLYSYTYKDGKVIEATQYFERPITGIVKAITKYDPATEYTDKVYYYDAQGTLKSTVTYQDYQPFTGVGYYEDQISTYENGYLTKYTTFYTGTEQIFEKKDNNLATYYAKDGKEIGRMTYKEDAYGALSPYTGTTFSLYNNKIYSTEKYDKGLLTYKASYNTESAESSPTLSEESFYTLGSLQKKITYFPNGKKQKEEIYSPSIAYEEATSAIYFNSAGKEIGRFDFEQQQGTKVTYSTLGAIENITKLNQGQITYAKTYVLKDNFYYEVGISTKEEDKYYLQSEIDFMKEGKFYNPQGELISSVIYKDGLPTTGIVYTTDGYSITETPYKSGEKDGVENKYYIYQPTLSPASKVYYTKGVRTKEETYNQDVLTNVTHYNGDIQEGLSINYDAEGNETSRLTYSNDMPYEGTEVVEAYEYTTTTVYQDGEKVTSTYTAAFSELPLGEVNYKEDASEERKLYDAEGNLQYIVTIKDNALNGPYTYYEKGKEKYKAIFADGLLAQGSVALNNLINVDAAATYSYEEETEQTTYAVMTYKKNTLTTSIIDIATGKEVFHAETKIKKGDKSHFPLLSQAIEISNLYPFHMLNRDLTNYYYY